MISIPILTIFYSFGLIIFFLGLQGIIFFPLTVVYEIWKKRILKQMHPFAGKVSILIPAYNEENTIRDTIFSIFKSDYPDIEVIVINDGSTDATEDAISDIIEEKKIVYIRKPNGGKASALNRGIEEAKGDVVIFTDADSQFLPHTVTQMVRWFGEPTIDAVCGNDAPLNPDTPIRKFLAVTTHIGTGFIRRALSMMRCLPIVTGNLGAVRTSVLRGIGGFREIWGEDLEITFRLHKNRNRIMFDPDPKVMAECPGNMTALWKQRIRWMRSYIKISFLHRDLFLNCRWRPFSFYLPVNFLNMAIVPLLQIVLTGMIPWALLTRQVYFTDTLELLTYLGLIFFLIIAIYSITLDRTFRDLIYLPYAVFLILPLSFFYNAVVACAWWKEYRQAEEKWNKIERRRMSVMQKTRWGASMASLFLIIISFASGYYYLSYVRSGPPLMAARLTQPAPAAMNLGLSTHFDAWDDWRDAIHNVMDRPMITGSSVIGIGAGRTEWAYFKWKGNEEAWSSYQKGADEDMLLTAVNTFHDAGLKVAAIIDPYAPNYLKKHPDMAAIKFDGEKSSEQIGFIQTVEGNYGILLLEMISYVSRNYPVDIINLTELHYYHYSFNKEDLLSYEAFSGNKGWPMTSTGAIDKDNPSLWEWRSVLMERYIERVAEVVHSAGKELYIDVPVSWDDFTRNGRESGLDYRRILKHADKIIIWNYFSLEDASPDISESLSRYMAENFPADSFYISIGLWGNEDHIDPETFSEALSYTLKGKTPFIWITPAALVTDRHWEKILPYLKRPIILR